MLYQILEDGDQYGLMLCGFSTEKEAKDFFKNKIENKHVFIVEFKIGKRWGSHSFHDERRKAEEEIKRFVEDHNRKKEELRIVCQQVY
tara:strand:+ start:953 stop:1216 length:264 start_codon:yes stop_codon:yes gene_type:complete